MRNNYLKINKAISFIILSPHLKTDLTQKVVKLILQFKLLLVKVDL